MRGRVPVSCDEHRLYRMRINSFDEKTANILSSKLHAAIQSGQGVFPIEIDSYGGDAYSLCGMIDTIESAKELIQVATVAVGKAFSSGIFALASGTSGLRFAGPSSSLMIHNVQARIGGSFESLKVDMKETSRLNKQLMKFLGKATGKDAKFYEEKLSENRDWYLTPQQAKRIGIVDHVKLPLFFTRSEASVVVA